jgi:hypothetical protein
MEFIRGAKKISELNSRWDRIQDWFCGTKIVEAKSLLFALMHQSSEISKQGDNNEHFAQNFLSLRDLAAPTHRHKFTATVVNKTITFGIVDASIKFDVLRTALNKNTENALNIMCPTHNGRFFGSFKKNNQQKCQTQCIKLKGINATTLKTIDSNTTTKVRNDDQWVDTVTQDGYQRKRLLQLAIQNSLVSKGFQP